MKNESNVAMQQNISNVNSSNLKSNTGFSGLKQLPQSVSKNSKYTENWINIKKIGNGIIYNDTNDMVAGIKIRPKNIFILEGNQMNNILINLMNFYNTIDYEFWLIVADRPVDIAMYQTELQLLLNNTQDQRIKKLISQDIQKGEFFINNDVVDIEYYILFKEKKMEVLQKKMRNLITGLNACDLVASQASTEDMYMIVDNFMNAGRNYDSGTVMPL